MDTTTILVVEDENIVALDIKNRLKKLGYAVTGLSTTGQGRPALPLQRGHTIGGPPPALGRGHDRYGAEGGNRVIKIHHVEGGIRRQGHDSADELSLGLVELDPSSRQPFAHRAGTINREDHALGIDPVTVELRNGVVPRVLLPARSQLAGRQFLAR